MNITGKNLLRSKCFHIILQITFQRSCTIYRIIAIFNYLCSGCICQFQRKFLICQTVTELFDHQVYYAANIFFCQWLEHDNFIQTVQKFRTEMSTQVIHNLFLSFWFYFTFFINTIKKIR